MNAGSAEILLTLKDAKFFTALDGVADGIKGRVRAMGAIMAATGAAATAALAVAAAQSKAAEARMRGVEAVLKDSTGEALSLAEAVNRDIGLSVSSVTQKIAEFSGRAEAVGFLKDQAVELSAKFVRLGADIDKAFGTSGGAETLQQAVYGSADAARKLGLDLSDAAVAAEFGRPIEQMTELQKAATRASMAQSQLQATGVSGSASADAYTAAQGRLYESFSKLTVAIGKAAQPGIDWFNNVLAKGMYIVAGVTDRITKFVQENEYVVSVAANVAGALTTVGTVLATVGATVLAFVASIAIGIAKMALFKVALAYIPVVGPIILKVLSAIRLIYLGLAAAGVVVVGSFAGVAAIMATVAYGVYRLHKATGVLSPVLRGLGSIGTWLKGIWDKLATSIGGVVGWVMKLLGLGGKGGSGAGGGGVGSSGGVPNGGGGSLAGSLTEAQRSAQVITDEMRQFADNVKGSLQTPQQKFDELAAKLQDAANKGLLTPDEFKQAFQQAKDDLDEALKLEFEKTPEGQRQKALEDFGKQLERETKTVEEEVSEKLKMIGDALKAGKISPEVAARAVKAANDSLAEHHRQIAEDAKKAQDAIRQDALDVINSKADLKLSIAKARGGKEGEAAERKITEDRIKSLKEGGFNEEARNEEIALLGSIIKASQSVIDKAQSGKDTMSTRSAQEAMFGRSGVGVDQEQLEELKKATTEQREAREVLERIAQEVEG